MAKGILTKGGLTKILKNKKPRGTKGGKTIPNVARNRVARFRVMWPEIGSQDSVLCGPKSGRKIPCCPGVSSFHTQRKPGDVRTRRRTFEHRSDCSNTGTRMFEHRTECSNTTSEYSNTANNVRTPKTMFEHFLTSSSSTTIADKKCSNNSRNVRTKNECSNNLSR